MSVWSHLREPSKRPKMLPQPPKGKAPNIDVGFMIKEVVKGANMDRPEDFHFHPSGIDTCARMYWFDWLYGKPDNKKGAFSWGGRLALMVGTKVHELLEHLMGEAAAQKILGISHFQNEVKLESVKERMRGSCDGKLIVNGWPYILEFKTANDMNFRLYTPNPKKEHVKQVQMYMHMDHESDNPSKVAYIVYFNKNTHEIAQHRVDYDPDYCEQVFTRLRYIRKCLNERTIPTENLRCELPKLDQRCPNYMRCKNYETKGELPLPIKH